MNITEISRRQFLYLSAVSPFVYAFSALAGQDEGNKSNIIYPRTITVLQNGFKAETTAYKRYIGYSSKASSEKYPNIAYLFYCLSYSEKVHAENYERILATLGQEVKPIKIAIEVHDTKSNLQKAAQNELEKIKSTYPDFIRELEIEGYEDAIINCMYSWKSHQQHEKEVNQILTYSGTLFGAVSANIEGRNLDFHVCKVCGSTIDKVPQTPCTICNRSMSNYFRVEQPK